MKRTLLLFIVFSIVINIFSIKESFAEHNTKDSELKELILQQKNNISHEVKNVRNEIYSEFINSNEKVTVEPLKLEGTFSRSIKASDETLIIKYPEINFKGYSVNLFPESSLTPEEVLKKYKDVYEALKENFKNEDFFSKDFLDYLTIFYMDKANWNNLKNKLPTPENFEPFLIEMDLATDVFLNNKILQDIKDNKTTQEELDSNRPTSLEGAVTKENVVLNDPYTKKEIEQQKSNKAMSRRGYNRWLAADYAQSWWCLTNNRDYPYYAKYFNQPLKTSINDLPYNGYQGKTQSNPRRGWDDCTNFVSQSLYEGGLSQDSKWNYKDGFLQKPTHSWGGASNLGTYLNGKFGRVSTNEAKTGDVAQLARTTTGRIFHTMLITKDAGNGITNKYLTYHTVDRKNFNANDVFSKYSNVVFYFYHIS